MKRYSVFAIAREAISYHMGWERAWASPAPKAAYDAIIIGAGGHQLLDQEIMRSHVAGGLALVGRRVGEFGSDIKQ